MSFLHIYYIFMNSYMWLLTKIYNILESMYPGQKIKTAFLKRRINEFRNEEKSENILLSSMLKSTLPRNDL